jgi:hypothetical protein
MRKIEDDGDKLVSWHGRSECPGGLPFDDPSTKPGEEVW